MNCLLIGFWFEAGRMLFGATVVAAIALPVAAYFGWLLWKTR